MENKEINSRFIQKVIMKKWAVANKISYTIYDDKNDHQNFMVKDFIKNELILENEAFSDEIKKGLSTLNIIGYRIINKILKQENNIVLTRKELVTLKFYFIANIIKTNLLKTNIEDLNDDYLFNLIIKKTKEKPKEIQELKMKILIEKFLDFRKGENPTFFLKEHTEIINLLKNKQNEFPKLLNDITKLFDLESSIKLQLNLLIKSRLAFVKFIDSELLLTEAGSFQEISEQPYLTAKYDFSVISPDMGILFIKEFLVQEIGEFLKEDSSIFHFSLNEKSNTEYVKDAEMKQAQIRFLLAKVKNMRDPEEMEATNLEFDMNEKPKFYTDDDKFKYQIYHENKEVADICNAMMLVHCKNSYIVYKTKDAYYDAAKISKTRNIQKLEKS